MELKNVKCSRLVPSKTLIVVGLTDKTTGETLKGAFEGALDARVAVDKETGLSKRLVTAKTI